MKTENKKTLRGSVLFTVVCVMALLIIFLTGTLALASASSNRAHKSYASSQASYTARAAIDTFVRSMERDPGIPAAIQDMTTDELTVEIKIPDKTLGVVGHYDKNHVWKENEITVENVPDAEGYVFGDTTGDGKPDSWVKVTAVKVTATCRVGKEEETVSAYIQKSASSHSEVNPGGLDGLQEVGANAFPNGGTITGGFGLGISKDASGLFPAHNQTNIQTKLSFINGSIVAGTSNFEIWVKTPQDADAKKQRPYSQTVVMGNVFVRDAGTLVFNDYKMEGNFTQKDIPYLYIDGTIGANASSVNLVVDSKSNKQASKASPYNVFIGTLDCTKGDDNGFVFGLGGSDLYLMDEYNPSEKYTVMYADRNYALEETFYETNEDGTLKLDEDGNPIPADKRDAADKAKDIKGIQKGNNFFGTAKGKSLLYDWTSSIVNMTDTLHKSSGGNIYSMGNLTLQNAEIFGDVRVNGDCTVKNGVTIHGDLIVKGSLTFSGGDVTSVNGTIYCDSVSGIAGTTNKNQLKSGYNEHIDELVTGYYAEVPNAIYENEAVPEASYEFRKAKQDGNYKDDDGNGWHWGILYPGDDEVTVFKDWNDPRGNADYGIYVIGDKWFESKPYYATKYDGLIDYDTIVENPRSIYKVDPDDTSVILNEPTEDEATYYKLTDDGKLGDVVDKSEAVRTYYTDPSGAIVSKDEAYENVTVGSSTPYTGSGKEPAYPASMTREAIYGYYDLSGEFHVNNDTKLIKNIFEVREDLNMDENGEYKKDVYFDHVPKSECLNAADESDTTVNKLPYAFLPNGHKNLGDKNSQEDKDEYMEDTDIYNKSPWSSDGNSITQNCIIGRADGGAFTPPKGNINITGTTDGRWIVLRNINIASADAGIDIRCDTSVGKVCFLIDGTVKLSSSAIIPVVTGGGASSYLNDNGTDGKLITPDMQWGIEYYGAVDSSVELTNAGGSTLVGTFMCPETSFASYVAGKYKCKYQSVYTASESDAIEISAPIVGSALFKNVKEAQNSFAVLNSGGGGASKDKKSVSTALGVFEVSYFTGA
ncbi:hypothetical protein [Ruminococcus flavefaciens]|uniref:hypothetical protein n=1 Tax=Ruminococcus flavefaciens TaxID=1265 RepID=UPI00048BA309|nr:hypothetical protein [Ruminococcus flavefaciens]